MLHISITTDSPELIFGGDLGWYLGYKFLWSVGQETMHSLRYLSHKTTIQTQPYFVIVCSIAQQPLLRLTPFLFVDRALVRARPWLCPSSHSSLPNPRYSSHKVPWPVSLVTQAKTKGFDWFSLCFSLIGRLVIPCKYDIKGGPSAPFEESIILPHLCTSVWLQFDKQRHSNLSRCDFPVLPAIQLHHLLFLKCWSSRFRHKCCINLTWLWISTEWDCLLTV